MPYNHQTTRQKKPMKPKYIIKVKCPECGHIDPEVYHAPTCGFTVWECPGCHHVIDLNKCTGEFYEKAPMDDIYINADRFEILIYREDIYDREAILFTKTLRRITGGSWRSRFARWLLKIKLL